MKKTYVLLVAAAGLATSTGPTSADFVSCNGGQQTTLNSATYNAHLWLDKALANVDVPQPNPNYSKWFGSYTPTRGHKVKQSLGNLKSHMTVANIAYHCGCPFKLEQDFPGVIATVDAPKYGIKEKPYHVYLCTNFFQLSDTGYDSKGGTLIHEMTHFDVVNNTRDFCKGTTNCQQKAASAPDDAIRSADSYEYYAESLQ